MEDNHPHIVDVVQTVKHLDAAQGVAHHLRIAVGTDFDALAVLVVHDADGLARNDERVGCTEAIRHERREIDALLHGYHRVLALGTELTDQLHHELAVCLGALFHLSVIGCKVLGRIAHLHAQSLAEFILAKRVRIRPLGGVFAWRIRLRCIEPRRGRAGNPACGRRCGKNSMLICQCSLPPSTIPHNAPAQSSTACLRRAFPAKYGFLP